MRDWTKTVPNASFAGQPFYIEREELQSAARKVAVHEYAKSEDHDTEDSGRKVRSFSFRAYIVGDTADVDAQAFIELCSTPNLVADLQLSFLGTYSVRCNRCDASAEVLEMGKIDLELGFIEAGTGSAFSVTALGDRIAASLMGGMTGAIGSVISAFAG